MESLATVVRCESEVDRIVTTVMCERPPSAPIAPAGLYETTDPTQTVLELHRLREHEGSMLTFETITDAAVPSIVGGEYILRAWWIPDARDLVVDTTRSWTRKPYTSDDDCVYCPLTYKWFGRGDSDDSVMEGYESEGTWITVEGYERYIRDDLAGIRGVND